MKYHNWKNAKKNICTGFTNEGKMIWEKSPAPIENTDHRATWMISGPHSQSVQVKKNTVYSERRLSLVKPGPQRGVSLYKTDPMTHSGIVF